MTSMEQVVAYQDICNLKSRYFRYVDTKAWAELEALFTPDAQLFFPENQTQPVDLGTTMGFIIAALEGATSIHHGHTPDIEITSPQTAHGIWAMEDEIYWPSDRPSILGWEYLHGYGHYHEDYVRVHGAWRIKNLKLTRLWTRKYAPSRSVV